MKISEETWNDLHNMHGIPKPPKNVFEAADLMQPCIFCNTLTPSRAFKNEPVCYPPCEAVPPVARFELQGEDMPI